ncbi:MAG TPA: hypothetical protein VHU84_00455 [Lacipirellulaceae bacterium]|jgi:hypothetical protein|nr:hypothetical protein [Lacipirellulaceae bacterium]
MPPVSLKAHFDGHSIQLDEPFELPPNAQLLITLLPSTGNDADDRAAWDGLGQASLARAYGPDEPEYSDADIVP